MITMIDATYLW